jgi:hypothetical protein
MRSAQAAADRRRGVGAGALEAEAVEELVEEVSADIFGRA